MVEFSGNGQTFAGYLVHSEAGAGPAVILLQEWWGLVGHIKEVADRLAGAGFTVLAPDLWHGKQTTEPDQAAEMFMALNIAEFDKVVKGAADYLDSVAKPGPLGVVGFCMGGQLAMYAACQDDRFGACVNFYGVHPHVKPDFANMACPVLGLFGEKDPYTTPEAVRAMGEALTAEDVDHTFVTYPGADHAFFNDVRPEVYHAVFAADAWERTVRFLSDCLVDE